MGKPMSHWTRLVTARDSVPHTREAETQALASKATVASARGTQPAMGIAADLWALH